MTTTHCSDDDDVSDDDLQAIIRRRPFIVLETPPPPDLSPTWTTIAESASPTHGTPRRSAAAATVLDLLQSVEICSTAAAVDYIDRLDFSLRSRRRACVSSIDGTPSTRTSHPQKTDSLTHRNAAALTTRCVVCRSSGCGKQSRPVAPTYPSGRHLLTPSKAPQPTAQQRRRLRPGYAAVGGARRPARDSTQPLR